MAGLTKVLADTGGIIALLDVSDKNHSAVADVVLHSQMIVPATILPEVDYLVTKYLGEEVSRLFFEDLVEGTFEYIGLDSSALPSVLNRMTRYADLPIGFVDASLAVLADEQEIQNILTLDRRHFSVIRSERYQAFQLLP
ncbi:PIN domain-containing protein [Euhalothece natronophila Z-M001]|uniref:PIN domain-containing protein n=1 Tax=Euhalothece natronophila Z-M001 TaxID=522448 RepID=A0A5B8NKK4_9CHRO|nr:PIN domain-containing protein [Euhalothece natronophila]QDZ39407.1 PIN domain-containing protein [Euhalothece natronophila Z-M001]